MEEKWTSMPIAELIKAIVPYLEGKDYTERYVQGIHRVYKHLQIYCTQQGISHFTAEIGQQFLYARYGVALGVKTSRTEVRRAMNMLSDYQQFGVVLRRTAAKRVYPVQFKEPVTRYMETLKLGGLGEATIRNAQLSLVRLTEYLNSADIDSTSEITMEHLNGYIKTALCNYCNQRIAHELRTMRRIMRFFYENEYHPEDLSGKIIRINNPTQVTNIPSAFSQDEVKRLLATIDRSGPLGKRDYALLLLVAKMGLRSGDIRNLRFEHIDWDRNTISIAQSKTTEPLILPLVPEIGWALIDYIQYGRPVTDACEVFVRQVAPHIVLKSFNNTILKYLRMAKIPIPKGKHHGLHSLRHSLATTLLEQDTPMPLIQEILGHVNANTTNRYISVDVKQLKTCALEVPSGEA